MMPYWTCPRRCGFMDYYCKFYPAYLARLHDTVCANWSLVGLDGKPMTWWMDAEARSG
jgi:hypothetical protein